MNLYRITLYDRYDRELQRIEQHATSMALALLVSEARLRGSWEAVSAQVDLVVDEPGFACLVDESAGQAEQHSVRAELHETNERGLSYELPRVASVDLDAVSRLEAFSREAEGGEA